MLFEFYDEIIPYYILKKNIYDFFIYFLIFKFCYNQPVTEILYILKKNIFKNLY